MAPHFERHGGGHFEQSERMMKAMGIIASNTDGTPVTAQTLPGWVHLQPSLTGDFQSYLVAASSATLDALEAEATCVVLVRFVEVDEDGAPTMAEMDESHVELAAVFNQFAADEGLPTFDMSTTPRELLAAFGITPGDVYDPEAGA